MAAAGELELPRFSKFLQVDRGGISLHSGSIATPLFEVLGARRRVLGQPAGRAGTASEGSGRPGRRHSADGIQTVSRIYQVIMPRLDQVLCQHEPELSSVSANRDVLVDGTLVRPGTMQAADRSAPDGLQFSSRDGSIRPPGPDS